MTEKIVPFTTMQDREKRSLAAKLADKYCDGKGGKPKKVPKKKAVTVDTAPSPDEGAITPEEEARYAEQDRGRWEESARQIIESGDVLNWFVGSWRKIVAGEEKNAKLLYLVATSRLFSKCMNVAIKGPSSAGKSEIRKQVLEFFPPEDIVSFTTLSEKSLLYYEFDFPHKILSMGEAAGIEEKNMQDYLLRELISEGKLRYPVVMKVDGKGMVTQTVVKNGPVAFMVTTTKAALHPENETRMLSVEVDDSEEQTRRVLDKVAEVVGMEMERAAVDYPPWRDFQRWLVVGNHKVVIPFAKQLGRLIVSAKAPRLRRDFGQLLLGIKAHALLNQFHREVDERGRVVADIDLDYVPVAELMGGIVSEASGTSIQKEVQETIDAVKVATSGESADFGATAFEVAKLLHLDKSSAWRRLRVAMDKGFITNLETRRGQPGRYRLTDQEIEPVELLPSPEAIGEAMQPVQPRNPTRNHQVFEELSGFTTGCTVAPVASPPDPQSDDLPESFEPDEEWK
jgi:hypothetical protein